MDTDPASRKTPRPTDRSMPDGVEVLIIGDGAKQYQRLRELERRLDAIMMRKKLDMQDSMQHNTKQYRTLRVSISNTVENQPWQGQGLDENTFDFNTGEEATYRVKIEGKLLDDDDKDDESSENDSEAEEDDPSASKDKVPDAMDQDSDTPSKPGSRTKLSHFFKAITVDFDRGKAGITADTPTAIEWKKPIIPLNSATLPSAADFDCLEFERKGDENLNCTINLYRDEEPERFLLSPELADLLDMETDDRASIMMKLWDYVKAMGLQQDDEKRRFSCDDRLRAVRIPAIPPSSSLFPQ
jgi:SWI/SNF-related matrix-associated actin-dependent regulator of chromatin subfamily D